MQIAQDLDFDVARGRQPALQEHGAVAERGRRLPARALDRGLEFRLRLDHPHAAAAATGRGLDQSREADFGRRRGKIGALVEFDGLKRRHVRLAHQRLRRELVAHRGDRSGRRADPDQAGVGHGAGEVRVLGQEAVAGMDRVGAGAGGRGQYLLHVEVGLRRGTAVQPDRFVRLGHEGRVRVAVRVDRDGRDPHVAAPSGRSVAQFRRDWRPGVE